MMSMLLACESRGAGSPPDVYRTAAAKKVDSRFLVRVAPKSLLEAKDSSFRFSTAAAVVTFDMCISKPCPSRDSILQQLKQLALTLEKWETTVNDNECKWQ